MLYFCLFLLFSFDRSCVSDSTISQLCHTWTPRLERSCRPWMIWTWPRKQLWCSPQTMVCGSGFIGCSCIDQCKSCVQTPKKQTKTKPYTVPLIWQLLLLRNKIFTKDEHGNYSSTFRKGNANYWSDIFLKISICTCTFCLFLFKLCNQTVTD